MLNCKEQLLIMNFFEKIESNIMVTA